MIDGRFKIPRGMRDIDPSEMAKRIWLQSKILQVLAKYSFQLVEPTTIEELKTLEAKSGPQIRNEIYWFKDKAGRRLGLRFDLTVGMTRMVASRPDLPEPLKLAAISGNWRYDEPQYGRYRYFTQWDAEIYGTLERSADAEVIALGIDLLDDIGLKDFEVKISSRNLIEGFLETLGIRHGAKAEKILRTVDKYGRASRESLIRQLRILPLKLATATEIIEFASIKSHPSEATKEIPARVKATEKGERATRELTELAQLLEAAEKADRCLFDFSIVRGIGYYDGIVFEAYDKGGEEIGAIFGGGRYDGLSRLYGRRDIPATGVAGGIERLMLSVERCKLFPEPPSPSKLFVAAVNDEVRLEAARLVHLLRKHGLSVDLDLRRRPLNKQLDYANSMGIPYVAIIGPRELLKGTVKLRDMQRHVEEEVTREELAVRLRKT